VILVAGARFSFSLPAADPARDREARAAVTA
jgi:hypothetical protein